MIIIRLPAEKEHCTFADFLEWDENERYEIINGEPYMMAEPTTAHQRISMDLGSQIHAFLKDKPCEVFAAPFGVRLFETENDDPRDVDTVVEPDLSVICDPSKLDDYGCKGAPDVVIEILSPSNSRHDRFVKYNLYQRAKVREYWIVDPTAKTVEAYRLDENGYLKLSDMYNAADTAKITALNDLPVDLNTVFQK